MMSILTELRSCLHANPELSGQESGTIRILTDFLKTHTSLELHPQEGWFYAVHREEGAESGIAVRADMDAVCSSIGKPFHGCGHDGHSTILAGLGLALEGKTFGKNIYLVFQPAEETGQGAKPLSRELLKLEKINEIYGFHNIPGKPLGTVLLRKGVFACASLGLTIRVAGAQSHAAYPEQGRNPGQVLSRIVLKVPEITANIPNKELLQSTLICLRAGEKNFGISAGSGEVCFTLRSSSREDLKLLEREICQYASGLCSREGFTCTFEIQDEFPDTTSDPAVFERVSALLQKESLPVEILEEPMRWSEDFGWYLKQIPGAFLGIGAGCSQPGLHTDSYEFPDALISPAIHILEILCKGEMS